MDDFEAYVAVAWPRLLRSAWLLTGDWYRAEDLLQTVLARAYRRWSTIAGSPDGYLRAMLASTYLTWWRRRWRGEVPVDPVPDTATTDPSDAVATRDALTRALAVLPRQQRAVLMLRFHADLTEARTAEVLGISTGTVKSYSARALAALRADPALRGVLEPGGHAMNERDSR